MFKETLNYDSFNKTHAVDVSQALGVLSLAVLEPSFLMLQPFIKFFYLSLDSPTHNLQLRVWWSGTLIGHIPVGSNPGVVSGSNSLLSYQIIFLRVNCHLDYGYKATSYNWFIPFVKAQRILYATNLFSYTLQMWGSSWHCKKVEAGLGSMWGEGSLTGCM